LNGVWQALNEANWDLEAHAAGFGRVVALGAADAIPPGWVLLRADRSRICLRRLQKRRKTLRSG